MSNIVVPSAGIQGPINYAQVSEKVGNQAVFLYTQFNYWFNRDPETNSYITTICYLSLVNGSLDCQENKNLFLYNHVAFSKVVGSKLYVMTFRLLSISSGLESSMYQGSMSIYDSETRMWTVAAVTSGNSNGNWIVHHQHWGSFVFKDALVYQDFGIGEMKMFNISRNSFSSFPQPSASLWSFARLLCLSLISYDTYLCVGGWPIGSGYTSNIIYSFDFNSLSWSRSNSVLSHSRDDGVACTYGQYGIFAGGDNWNGGVGSHSNGIDIYNAATQTWTSLSLSIGKRGLAGFGVGTKFYLFGGFGEASLDSAIEIIDLEQMTISRKTLPSIFRSSHVSNGVFVGQTFINFAFTGNYQMQYFSINCDNSMFY